MKVFFIYADSASNDKNVLALISAFAPIESIGRAGDMLEAIETVRSRYPGAMVSDGRTFDRKPELLSSGQFVILPREHSFKDRSAYIGVDFSSIDPPSRDWVFRSIRKVIEDCHGKVAGQ